MFQACKWYENVPYG